MAIAQGQFGGGRDAVVGHTTAEGQENSAICDLAVEATDLLFAIDSIPAVLAVSRNPFVVYTSNIAAILGLRSLYFALSSLLDRFHYLHYGLGALLGFVALKMLAAHWVEIPVTWSLAIMGVILGVCAAASLMAAKTAANKGRKSHI